MMTVNLASQHNVAETDFLTTVQNNVAVSRTGELIIGIIVSQINN